MPTPELVRLDEDARRLRFWKRWGPYLAERQWGTVREDYSRDGTCWEYFPHDHARSRAYRWGEDGLLGICDRDGILCFAVALWNGKDPILKERLFGLTGPEGNHGEDVKECYFYLDATPTASWLEAMYRYPQAEYPYARLVEESRRRTRLDPEYELDDTGVFDDGRWWDVTARYAKAGPADIHIRLTVANHGPEAATLHLLPTLWYRNTWRWGRAGEDGYWPEPWIRPVAAADGEVALVTRHASLGTTTLVAAGPAGTAAPELLFTDNETDQARLFGGANARPWVKDAFHEYVVRGRRDAVNPAREGTKAALHYVLTVPAGGEATVRLRLVGEEETPSRTDPAAPPSRERLTLGSDAVVDARRAEADAFYARRLPAGAAAEERRVLRQAYAGLIWSKQFYHFVVKDWLDGDPAQPPPPPERRDGRDHEWLHLFNRDVVLMPDAWEYPWYASWDLAFHCVAVAGVDADLAKEQLILFLREWYMHPAGQIPAYEFAFGDVNPPVHAWAVWRVYEMTAPEGKRDRLFLERAFHKLLLNFTWWVNRKDVEGNNLFGGGFLGLDNIGVFDRSKPLPTGGHLEQADGTAWMAFYCTTMLTIALELAAEDPAYEDVASKFFEHFVAIADAMNSHLDYGLWDPEDGFYYDELHLDTQCIPLRLRSLVGVIPLFACLLLEESVLARLPGFTKRMRWFLEHRKDLADQIAYMEHPGEPGLGHRLLAIASRERLTRVLRYLLDEREFLSPHGVRSLSRVHADHPYVFEHDGQRYEVRYDPGESTTGLFGGNSNWRGPVWFPINFLLLETLQRYDHFYGDSLRVECPTGSGVQLTLAEVARELSRRLISLWLPDAEGRRPFQGGDPRWTRPEWRDLLLFHEYFHADTGAGLGASHQTGWTALVVRMIEARGADGGTG